eukprot:scaffold13595_cov87-Skeletonema_marinoi.AAC.1
MAAWCSHNTTPSFQFSIKFLKFCKYKRGGKSLALECHMLCRLCLLRWARYDSGWASPSAYGTSCVVSGTRLEGDNIMDDMKGGPEPSVQPAF